MNELDEVQQAERRAMTGDRQAVLLVVSELRRLREQAAADAQALADVRTLDDWARERFDVRTWVMFPPDDERLCLCSLREAGKSPGAGGFPGSFTGETEDAARHAAAGWVRKEQSK